MKNYIVKTLNGMAYGLFATLIIGVIIQQIGTIFGSNFLSVDIYNNLSRLMGVGIALGIGIVLKKDGLVLVMIAVIGAISTQFGLTTDFVIKPVLGPGNPMTVYFVTVVTILILENVLKKKTPVDIILIPLVAIFLAIGLTLVFSLPLDFLVSLIQRGLAKSITFAPLIMVVIISVSMGMILTSPISSAAVAFIIFDINAASVNLASPEMLLAAGAAVIGTSIQMIGFAIQSRRDNNIGGVISVAIGTSMFQFKNIVKKPILWLPTILATAITSVLVYLLPRISFLGLNGDFISTKEGAGMGTSVLVGPLQSLNAMYNIGNIKEFWIYLTIIIIFGGLLVYIFDKILYKRGIIELGDLSLSADL